MTGLMLVALPGDGRVLVRLDRTGRPQLRWENCLILPEVTTRWLDGATRKVWADGVWPTTATPRWAVNLLADAEMYARGLAWHDAGLPDDLPVFNHPRAIAQTRRDLSALSLAGVPGLVVPVTRRFVPHAVDDFEAAFAAGGFQFPVLVRPGGLHVGAGLLRIDSPADWAQAANSTWVGAPQFMTQFEDFATSTGVYHKARVLFVGGTAFVRHIKSSSRWLVHNRAEGRLSDDAELPMIEQLQACPVFQAACGAIAARLGLDYCGLDLGVDLERQRYVLFECNPAMAAFFPERPDRSDHNRARRERLQVPAAKALDALLRAPAEWAASQGRTNGLPSVAHALSDALPFTRDVR